MIALRISSHPKYHNRIICTNYEQDDVLNSVKVGMGDFSDGMEQRAKSREQRREQRAERGTGMVAGCCATARMFTSKSVLTSCTYVVRVVDTYTLLLLNYVTRRSAEDA